MSTGETGDGSEQGVLPIDPGAPRSAGDEELTQPVAPPTKAPGQTQPQQAQPQAAQAQPAQPSRPRPASIREGVLTVEDHLEKILRGIGPLAAYDQPLVESLGLPLHEAFVSPMDLPLFDNSSMDGYAVRSEDVAMAGPDNPVMLPVVGEIQAGSAKPFAISAGTAVKIMTGAPIPRGADAVVPLEDTDRGNARVQIFASAKRGDRIRPRGEDVTKGDTVLGEGTVLGPREIGLLAALGAPRVKARPRPRVVVISTGSELREPGTHLDYDSINDGNSYMLAAAVREAGAICYRVGAVDDNPRTFQRVLSEQLVRADLVVTSGGISKGDHDVVKETLSALGTVEFNEVAMQPGKPQGFGRVFDEQTPIITLPGNAVSAYVSFEVFVLPAIRRMMGRTPYRRPMVHAVLASDIRSRPGVRQYVRGVFEVTHRGAKVTPLAGAGSHLVGTLAKANALIIVGEDQTALNMGDTVRTLVLDRPF
ncbi:gephyrin-like molybdotransferase Glp [Aeromicrobium chenweiae]|uniref:Molybdopterin molybdenumtransferase n=1 Tax=Aeromicrobium chenweiae TaxID=2079793 RepID=A0A2S0WJB2_9ACTN|nr:gephyrin-like molybdotransferase Glp [Aeromicrobium chenweiae]AWB91374.1 molybdopterin molybdenumtransferase MoeA [Aeromicrobium chenweiae]TGN30695.1 molybdopterin molybdotransferase MoeA [Aeromicrobium chenweiae]